MRRVARVATLALAVGLVLALAAGPASADPGQQVVLPMRTADWSATATFQQFDPAAGDLLAVHVSVTADLQGRATITNTTDALVAVVADLGATVSVNRPAGGSTIVEASPAAATAQDVGPLQQDVRDVSDTRSASVTLTSPADLAAFTGTGTIRLGVTATAGSWAPSLPGVDIALETAAGAAVTVTYDFVADNRAPDPPTITASPAAFTAGGDLSLSFTTEPGATTECTLTDDWAPCTSPWALPVASDGTYTASVRATDPAGNQGGPATRTFVLDRSAPAPPTFTSSPVSPGANPSPSWAFTVESGATAECSVDGGAWAGCTTPVRVDLTADGSHTIGVRAVDAAGNEGPAVSTTYVLDRVPPGLPTITTHPPSPGMDTTPTWEFTADPGSTLACSVDSGAWVACSDGRFTANLTGPGAEGPHAFAVRATDTAGNPGPAATGTYVLDLTPPGIPTILTFPASPTNSRHPTWTFSALDGTTECRMDEGAWQTCTGSFVADLTAAAQGDHRFSVRAVDAARNPGEAATHTIRLDTVKPDPPMLTGEPADPSRDDSPSWTFGTEAGATAWCAVDAGPWQLCNGSFTPDLTLAADGPHTFTVRAVDAAGNEGDATSDTFVLDRAAPASPSITLGPPPTSGAWPTWVFTGPPATSLECSIDAGGWVTCAGSFTANLTAATDGLHTFAVRAIDRAGNPSPPATGSYLLDRVAPDKPQVTVAPESPASSRFPSWSFTAEAGSRVRVPRRRRPVDALRGRHHRRPHRRGRRPPHRRPPRHRPCRQRRRGTNRDLRAGHHAPGRPRPRWRP